MPVIIRACQPAHKHAPPDAHEWVSFDDPDEERTWLFDVTFLASSWTCIFGQGCQGVLTGPAPELVQGCCSYGAHFTGKKDARTGRAGGSGTSRLRSGSSTSRAARGWSRSCPTATWAPGWSTAPASSSIGPGSPPVPVAPCTRRRRPRGAAMSSSNPRSAGSFRSAARTRPSPDGRVTSVVRQWDRRHWGEGGEDFHWWCTEDPAAFVGHRAGLREHAHRAGDHGRQEGLQAVDGLPRRRTAPADPGHAAPPSDDRAAEHRPCGPSGRSATRPAGSSSAKDASFGAVPRISS